MPDILGMEWCKAKGVLEENNIFDFALICTGPPRDKNVLSDKSRVIKMDLSKNPCEITLCNIKDIIV